MPEFSPKPSSFKSRLKKRLKQYNFIKYPYDIFIRPVRRAVHRLKTCIWNFLLSHEPSRSAIIRRNGYKICKLSTVYDYCKEHDGILRVYDASCEYPARPLCRTREDFEANIFAEPVMRPAWYIYAAKIRDAVIFGKEDVFFADGHCLTDRKTQIQGSHYYISRNIPEIKPEIALVKMPKNPEVIERGINLMKMWSENIFHFTFEGISRLQLVDEIEEYRTWPLIIDEEPLYNPWRIQLLEMVNTYKHPIIPVTQGQPYLVREMIYPSFLNWYEKDSGYAPRIHTRATEYIRDKILHSHQPAREYRNVYVVRGDKRFLNENEVIECLSRHGIEIVYQKSYDEVLDVFMTADNIITPVGSNMVSIIASKPETQLYVICPFEYHAEILNFGLTDASKRTLHFIPANVHKLGPVLNQTDFTVDISRIEALAQQLSR